MFNTVPPHYSKRVLIGNWMDRQYTNEYNGNGILPGLHISNKCEQHRSLSQDTYRYEPFKSVDTKTEFMDKRATGFRNFRTSTTSNVKLIDDADLKDNYTTTNTLVYDLLPRLREELALKQSQPASKVPERQPEADMLQCFGNLTKTRNIARQAECAKMLDKLNHMQTTYGSAYNHCKSR